MRAMTELERLECRRLLAVNLVGEGAEVADTVLKPGQTLAVVVGFAQEGATSFLVAGQVSVQVKLVPHPFTQTDLSTLSFDDSDAITIGSTGNSGPEPSDPSGPYRAIVSGTIPSDAPAGTYAIMYELDSPDAIAEQNESDNTGIVFGHFQVATADGRVQLVGTEGADSLYIERKVVDGKGRVYFDPLNTGFYYPLGAASAWEVQTLGGDDVVVVYGLMNGLIVDLGEGHDRFKGGQGDETVSGGAGKDRLFGGFGNDRLNGNGGHDTLLGDFGDDRLYGYAGNDRLDGGFGNDRLQGDAGADTLSGGAGNDRFFAQDANVDFLHGGGNTDAVVEVDAADVLASIEQAL